MEYYHTPKEYISSGSLTIVDDEAKHLARVLRKTTGAEIFVTDGEGNLYKTKIGSITKELVECAILEKFLNLNEPSVKITLYPSLIKSPDRFEFIIEKSVELGVYEIQPVVSENVINKTSDKTERWQSIAMAAMKQSQRCYLPKVNKPLTFQEAVSSANSELKLIAHEKINNDTPYFSFKDLKIGDESSVSLFIGPEGGFTDEEIEIAKTGGFKPLNLGARKYRSETAAILAMGLLLNI